MAERIEVIDGERISVPKWIYRDGPGWRVDVDRRRKSGVRFRRYIADAGRKPPASLEDAIAVVASCVLTSTPDGRTSPSPRKVDRCFRLYRVTRQQSIAFTLRIEPSRSAWLKPWMTLFLGTDRTITQTRIDQAIALLTARWGAFRRHATETSIAQALMLQLDNVPPAPQPRAQLHLSDVVRWTGMARGISFSPKACIQPSRRIAFAPEIGWRPVRPFTPRHRWPATLPAARRARTG